MQHDQELLLAALQAHDDLERLRWIRDNSYPVEIGTFYEEDYRKIAERNKMVFSEDDSWGWIIAKMETHVSELRRKALGADGAEDTEEGEDQDVEV